MPLRDLVPGDIIKLSAGDMIPATCGRSLRQISFVIQGSEPPVLQRAEERGAFPVGTPPRPFIPRTP